jgi:pimeloyl-ACP methyl ester carboxylesterase
VAFIEEATTMLDDPEALETLIYEHILARAQASSEEEQAMLGDLEEYARMMTEQTTPTFTADWFGSFIAYDPGQDWAQTTIPMLSIYGGKDVQVDAAQNAPPLASALLDGGNEDIAIVVLPDANHLFQAAGTGSPTEYGTLPSEFTPDLVPTILDWLALHLDDAPAAPAATPAATPAAPMATPVA